MFEIGQRVLVKSIDAQPKTNLRSFTYGRIVDTGVPGFDYDIQSEVDNIVYGVFENEIEVIDDEA